MSKVTPKGLDLFGSHGPSMAVLNRNITGEEVKKVREDGRSHAEIARAYDITEELVRNLKAKG